MSQSLHRERALEPLLDRLLETVTGELGFTGAGILFRGVAGEALAWRRFASAADRSLGLRDLRSTASTAPQFLRRLLGGESQLLSADAAPELEPPLRHWLAAVGAEQMLLIPLMGRNRGLGALAVDNRQGAPRFTDDDRARLELLVHQCALAVENIRFVDDLRRLQEPSPRADRLAALGRLAAGLAHEIHNPLVSAHTFMTLAPEKRREPDDEFWVEYHAIASREVDRIRRLVDAMARLEPGEPGPGSIQAFDPGALAARVATRVREEADRAQVVLTLECDPEIPKIHAVKHEIQQVFLHLMRNAIHASPAGAEVRVCVLPDPAGNGVCVEVIDRGTGISEEDLERIFDPFFTTQGARTRRPGAGPDDLPPHRGGPRRHDRKFEARKARKGRDRRFCVRAFPAGSDLGHRRPYSGRLTRLGPGSSLAILEV